MDASITSPAPLLSICIPAYNAAALLKRCLDSITIQTFRDFEVVVTDDSTDGRTAELVGGYADRLPIQYEHHAKGLGSPGNWNRGLDLAKGKWVMVLHQDDWLTTERSLDAFMQVLQGNDEIYFAFGVIEPDEKASVVEKIPGRVPQLRHRPELILMQNIIGPPSNVVFRKGDDRFDPNLFWVVDYEMYYRWLQRGERYAYIRQKLVEIGRHDEQVTAYCDRNPDIKLRENAIMMDKHAGTVRMSLRLYDYLWRQVRNTAAAVPEKMATLEKVFPPLLQQMWTAQQKLDRALLQKGWYSKIMMIFSWLKESKHH